MDWIRGGGPYSGLSTPQQSTGFPSLVGMDDVRDHLSSSSVVLGVDSTLSPLTVDLDSESPHILVNAATGAGKSAVARSVAVQRLSQGDVVVILDRKMHSHRWARPLAPLVHYADQVPDIGSALFNLGRELHRRNILVRDHGDDAPVGPRIIVLFEELNATLTQLKALDRRVNPDGYSALDAFGDVMFMGRAVGMHMIAMAQLASYRSGMTQDLLENFGAKVMIDYSDKAWRWLVPDCGRYQVAPSAVGRGMVCHRGRARESQLIWMTEASAASEVLKAVPAQRQARALAGDRRNLPQIWRQAIGR